ncbi:MAG: helix-hairpin-helix domain-containing protein [Balneolaceae bacterium]
MLGSLVALIIVVGIVWLFVAWDQNKINSNSGAAGNTDSSANAIRGYEIHVTPDIRTRLSVLNLRGKTFNSRAEAEAHTFDMREAIVMTQSKSWEELGINLPEIAPADIWTDIGSMSEKKVEAYYQFLERLREILEDETLNPAEKVKLVRKMDDPGRFKTKLRKQYGRDFPINMFIESLVEIDGVSEAVAVQLFKKKIYTKNDVLKLSRKELLKLNGVGEARADKKSRWLISKTQRHEKSICIVNRYDHVCRLCYSCQYIKV